MLTSNIISMGISQSLLDRVCASCLDFFSYFPTHSTAITSTRPFNTFYCLSSQIYILNLQMRKILTIWQSSPHSSSITRCSSLVRADARTALGRPSVVFLRTEHGITEATRFSVEASVLQITQVLDGKGKPLYGGRGTRLEEAY